MAEEAEDYGDCSQYSRRDVRGSFTMLQVASQDQNEDGQSYQPDRHTAAIDSDTTYPFDQIVSAGAEDKPLVAEESHRDGDEVRQNRGIHVAERPDPCERPIQKGKERVAKDSIESAYQQVADKLRQRFV